MVVSKLAAPRNESPSENTQFYVMVLGSREAFIDQSRNRGRSETCKRLYLTVMTSMVDQPYMHVVIVQSLMIVLYRIIALKTLKCLLVGMLFYVWPCKLQ